MYFIINLYYKITNDCFSYANSKHRAANLVWGSLAYNRANFKLIQRRSLFAWVNTGYLALLLILYMWIFEMYKDKIAIAYKCSSWTIKTQVRNFHAYCSPIVFIDILCRRFLYDKTAVIIRSRTKLVS